MTLPTISQYADSIANPFGLTRTLGEFRAERDAYAKVKVSAGNNAAIFKVKCGKQELMLKCYFRLGRNTKPIYDYLAATSDPLYTQARYLPAELYVYDYFGKGRYYDIVAAPWISGNTLDTEIKRAVQDNDPDRISALSAAFEAMAYELLDRKWAHGDIKPENIIVGKDNRMTLADYDAMYIPCITGDYAVEIGTPAYQHPSRDCNFFCKSIDDYSIAIIAVSLRVLSLDPSLYNLFNQSDNILLYPHEILSGTSEAYEEILRLLAVSGEHAAYNLALQLQSPSPSIPRIKEMVSKLINGSDNTELPILVENNGMWGYADRQGNIIIDAIYEDATEFSEGLAIVSLQGLIQAIDIQGNVVIRDGFDNIKPFSCEMAAIEVNGLWGFIDTKGSMVISPRYEAAGSMHENRAPVRINGKWGYIDNTGDLIIEPAFDRAYGFRNGMAIAHKDEKALQLDTSGAVLIPDI